MKITFTLFLFFLCSRLAFAGVEQISEKEFQDLAAELAPKVNLFQAGWQTDPEAEFYGGTTRDYLYWVKGQFKEATNRPQAEAVLQRLRALPAIDVRDFIIGDSDVDIISNAKGKLDAAEFGVRKIDFQARAILDPTTELGKNEILQGYIPAEKIRLGRDGFHASSLGQGLSEIYSGNITVHFSSPADFAASKYAKEGINHPILLALRYLRLQGMNYFRTHGDGFPNETVLFSGIDAESMAKVQAVIDQSRLSKELAPFLTQHKFVSWINGAIQKSFRSFTNPTAALMLMQKFGVDKLADLYPEIETLNQYVFSKFRDRAKIGAALREDQVNEAEFYHKPEDYFPDGKLYHGTKEEASFRSILFQGIMPSTKGSAGFGLYGVAKKDKKFSEDWAGGKDRLLSLDVSPETKIVDITQGEGKRVWDKMKLTTDKFSDRYGVDILRYPYGTQAFVVKNGAVLSRAQGVYRSMMSLSSIIEAAAKTSKPVDVLRMIAANQLSSAEVDYIWRSSAVKPADMATYLRSQQPIWADSSKYGKIEQTLDPEKNILKINYWHEHPEVQEALVGFIKSTTDPHPFVWKSIAQRPNPSAQYVEFADSLFKKIKMDQLHTRNLLEGTLFHQPHPTPNAVKAVLSELSTKEGRDGAPLEYLRFLAKSQLNEEAGHAWEIFQTIAPGESKDLSAYLGEALLRSGFHAEEVRDKILSEFTQIVGRKPRLYWPRMAALAEFSPQDPRVIAKVAEFIDPYFADLGSDSSNIATTAKFTELVKNMGSPKAVKEELVKLQPRLQRYPQQNLNEVFQGLSLTDDEWKTLLSWTNNQLKEQGIKNLAEQKPRTAARSRLILDLYVSSWAGFKEKRILADVIAQDPHPEVLREYLLKVMLDPEVSEQELEGGLLPIISLAAPGLRVPHTPEFESAAITFLEQKGNSIAIPGSVLDYLPLGDPVIAQKVQKLFLDKKLLSANFPDLVEAAERMHEFSEEFRQYLNHEIDHHAHTGLSADYIELHRVKARALISSTPTCAQRFGALGGE